MKKLYGTISRSINMVSGGKVTDQVTLYLAKVSRTCTHRWAGEGGTKANPAEESYSPR